MRRRTLLKYVSAGLGVICAAVVGLPGVSFIFEALRRRGSSGEVVRRVARLKDVPLGKPVPVPIVGARQDAWTMHDQEVLGRVWLVRQKGDSKEQPAASQDGDAPSDRVMAFTAICPHLGCLIQHDAKENRFLCPCHRAVFGLNGERLTGKERGRENHAPRAMDSLECQLVQDDETAEWWVEVKFQKFEQGLTKKVVKA